MVGLRSPPTLSVRSFLIDPYRARRPPLFVFRNSILGPTLFDDISIDMNLSWPNLPIIRWCFARRFNLFSTVIDNREVSWKYYCTTYLFDAAVKVTRDEKKGEKETRKIIRIKGFRVIGIRGGRPRAGVHMSFAKAFASVSLPLFLLFTRYCISITIRIWKYIRDLY